MAKKISNSDIFESGLFQEQIQNAESFLTVLKEIRQTLKENVADQAKALKELKSINSVEDLKKEAEAKKEINKITDESLKLKDIEKKLEKDLEKVKTEQFKQNEKLRSQLNDEKKAVRESIKLDNAKSTSINKQVKSLAELQKKNNDLIRQRKDLDITTEEGKKQFDELTVAIQRNNAALKKYDADIGVFNRNVGNYPEAVEGGIKSTLAFTAGFLGVTSVASKASDFMRDSIQVFKDFDQSLKELGAITGLTGQDLQFFADKAKETGENTTTSAQAYLEAVKLIGSAQPTLLAQPEALDKVTQAARTLAEASGLELPESASALTDVMNQLGLDASQVERTINALAAGSKAGAAEVPQVSEALLKFGAIAKNSNISLEESVALIETMAERGLKGAEAGTALRNVLAKISAPETLPTKALDALNAAGVDLEKLSDKTIPLNQRLTELSKISGDAAALTHVFGLENQVAGSIILNNIGRFDELTAAVTNTNTAYDQASINQSSAASQSEILQNKLETLQIVIGEKLLPVINGLLDILVNVIEAIFAAAEAIGEFLDMVDEYLGGTQSMIKNAAELAKAQEDAASFTGELARASAILTAQFNDGKISVDQYQQSLDLLKKVQKDSNSITQEGVDQMELLIKKFYSGGISVADFNVEYAEILKNFRISPPAIDSTSESFDRLSSSTKKASKATKEIVDNYNSLFNIDSQWSKLVNDRMKDQDDLAKKEAERRRQETQDEIDRVNEEARKRKEDEDFQKYLADKEKERIEDIKNASIMAAEEITKRVNEFADLRIKKIAEEQSASEKRLDELRTAAEKGVLQAEESLAFEEKKIAELERKRLQEEKRKQRSEIALTSFKVLADKVDRGDKSPLTSTVSDILKLSSFINSLPTFYDGTENTGNGGNLDSKGGFLSVLHPGERVLTKDQNAMIGSISNEDLALMAKEFNSGAARSMNVINQLNAPFMSHDAILSKFDDLEAAVREIPVQNFQYDEFRKALIEEIKAGNKIIRNHYGRKIL